MSAARLVTNRAALRGLLMGANVGPWAPAKAEKPERLPRTRAAAVKAVEKVVADWRR